MTLIFFLSLFLISNAFATETQTVLCRESIGLIVSGCNEPFDFKPSPRSGLPLSKGQVTAYTRITGTGPIQHVWVQENQVRKTVPIKHAGTNWRGISRKRFFGKLSVGQWQVKVHGPQGELLESIPFSIENAEHGKLRMVPGRAESHVSTTATEVPSPASKPSPEFNRNKNERIISWKIGLGINQTKYQQSAAVPLNLTSLDSNISLHYGTSRPQWFLTADFNATAVTLLSHRYPTPRFIGANLLIGRTLDLNNLWTLAITGGAFFSTMVIPEDTGGYRNLWGPQLTSNLQYDLGTEKSLAIQLTYSPITNGLAVLDETNRQAAAGITYSWLLWERRKVALTAEYTGLQFTASQTTISKSSALLKFGFYF